MTKQGGLHLDGVGMSELMMEENVREGMMVQIDESVESEEWDEMKLLVSQTFS